ncbi:hypothetical protein ACU635_43730 [[Actinomadura] parvosata]|uniref:hypothetical protein n=1 Tax=[Actinomadura] parvosata TaxID=1955412 RepID=UPI00406C06D7
MTTNSNPEPCTAEVIDGYEDPATCWGCEDCTQEIYDNVNRAVEMGDIDADEAHDQLVQFEQFGIIP